MPSLSAFCLYHSLQSSLSSLCIDFHCIIILRASICVTRSSGRNDVFWAIYHSFTAASAYLQPQSSHAISLKAHRHLSITSFHDKFISIFSISRRVILSSKLYQDGVNELSLIIHFSAMKFADWILWSVYAKLVVILKDTIIGMIKDLFII